MKSGQFHLFSLKSGHLYRHSSSFMDTLYDTGQAINSYYHGYFCILYIDLEMYNGYLELQPADSSITCFL